MEKQDIYGWIDALYAVKAILTSRKKGLLQEFGEEFPPRKNTKGWILVGTPCYKRGCTDCPHMLKWRWYERISGKALMGKRRDKLPQTFWKTRKPETVTRFRYYDGAMREINADWEKIQKALKKIHLTAMANYNALAK